MYDLLRGRNEGIKDECIKFAQELVRIPSVSLHEGPLAVRVEREMQAAGYQKVFRDDAGNVIGILYGRDPERTVLLNCHLDTVGAGDQDSWQRAPWSGDIVDGYLHGLGAADCKGGLAAQVYAGLLLRRAMLPLRGNLVVAATVAEENGRSVGLRHLMDHTLPELGLKPMFAVLGEPSNLGLYYGHEGWFELEVRVEANEYPAAAKAAEVIYQQLSEQCALWQEGDSEAATLHRPRFEEADKGHLAIIRMARRLTSADSVQAVLKQIKHHAVSAAESIESVAVEVEVREETQKLYTGRTTMVRHVTSAWETDPFNPLLARAREALTAGGCAAKPGKWRLGRLGMATCGGVLVNDYKIPAIGYGPGTEELAHSAKEAVSVDNISEATYGTALIAHSLVGVPVYGWTSDDEI